jgi:hypothetical protein
MGMTRIATVLLALSIGCAAQAQLDPQPPDSQGGVLVEVVGGEVVQTDRSARLGQYQARWEMDSAGELAQSWWHWSGATTTFEQGIATIGGSSYEEWMQRTDKNQSLWWETIHNESGFRIQTRMRVVQAGCGGVGLWIHDGARMLKVFFCDGKVGIGYPFAAYVDVDTSRFRTYTVEGRADWIRIAVDGEIVLERQGPETTTGAGTATLTFGNLGGTSGVGQWDWLSYDTRPELVDPGQAPRRYPERVQPGRLDTF